MRHLVGGYGWQRTSAIMQALDRGDLPAALALVDERHAEQARKRLQVRQALDALRTLAAQAEGLHPAQHSIPLRVGEAAKQVGVRVSPVHFLEHLGLPRPAATVSMTSARCALCASWHCLEPLATASTSSVQCSARWQRVGPSKPLPP